MDSKTGRPVMLITGASSGIGAATARMAVERGYAVMLVARRQARLEALVLELGSDAASATGDVGVYADLERVVGETLERFGRIDAVFANAGGAAVDGQLTTGDPDAWASMVQTNLLGVAYTTRAAHKALVSSQGDLVITGSVNARMDPRSLYGVTKWAVAKVAEQARVELGRQGVRVTLVHPGTTFTEFFDGFEPEDGLAESDRARVLAPEDVAETILDAIGRDHRIHMPEIMIKPVTEIL